MASFTDLIKENILVVDGAMGTILQDRGLSPGACPEALNLTNPQLIAQIHREYLQAGADIATANTFGATPLKLKEYGLEKRAKEINMKAIEIAKTSFFGKNKFVAGSIGPLGKLIKPLGHISFDAAYEEFSTQASFFQEAGADLIIIETMGDLGELRAAILAAKENFKGSILATMTFEAHGRTFTGTDPVTAAVVAESLGIAAFGANCSVGSHELLPIAKKLVKATNLPILISPNAGMPEIQNGKTVFNETPTEMAKAAKDFLIAGVGLIGSCCGSTSAHTAAIKKVTEGFKPRPRTKSFGLRLASRTKVVTISLNEMPVIIGERINPTGKKQLSQEIRDGKMSIIQKEAINQVEKGAQILDVNVGVPGTDEAVSMENALLVVQRVTDVPVMIDSTDPRVIEKALKTFHGKAIINSVNGEEDSLSQILPLAKKYGAAVLALALDEKGLPETAEERLAIIDRIVNRALKYGIPKRDIIADCLVLTVSAQPEATKETLRSLLLIKEKLGIPTSLGISNVSFGLPNRPLINEAFFAMALGYGLDAAIINPLDEKMMNIYAAANVLANRDLQGRYYIKNQRKTKGSTLVESKKQKLNSLEEIHKMVLMGEREEISFKLEEILALGFRPLEIFDQALIPAIEEVGKLFEEGVYFLPQLIASSDAMSAAFSFLKPEMERHAVESLGTIILATVKGDIHDIGKNIFGILLRNHGFNVIDLGRNVDNAKILAKAEEQQAEIIALSALMTTTMSNMEALINTVKRRDLPYRVIVGGAAVSEEYAKRIDADGYAPNAIQGVELAKKLLIKK